ncbi:SDR family NAD(P)-dependent oxidoreductase [Olivibacter sitiensis]|uniref:SDR family NAD(P)-dependent oxidoreductase n=1 Tax=Olivibacter sitiensis TaxID=376470 RepID=UPI00041FF724|nr:SDR family oxidoreductase [Olivibacter sitiensis]
MDLQLRNKKVLVTGSTAGIGLASAKLFAQEGAFVYINGRTQERVDEAIENIKNGVPNAQLQGVVCDFSDSGSIKSLIEQIPDLDVLVNNVGIYGPKPFAEITDEDWFRIFEVNVMSGVRLARHYFPLMLQKNSGRILFLASESAIQIPEDMIHYGFSKTALLAISRGLAELTKGTNVTVNAILPGPTWTEANEKGMQQEADEKGISLDEVKANFFKEARPTSLLQRFATAEEVANMIVYVGSGLSSATNGAPLRVDGGVVKSAF